MASLHARFGGMGRFRRCLGVLVGVGGRLGGLAFGFGGSLGGDLPGLAECVEADCIPLAGGLFDGLHGRVKELVDESASEGFNGGDLLGGEGTEARLDAMQFALTNLFCLALQGNDGGGEVDGALALVESLDLAGDEGLGVAGFAIAGFHVGRGYLLQVVDVVDEDAVELVHGRIDVAGDGDVDEEHGAIAAAMEEGLSMLRAEDVVGRAGGADDDVGVAGYFVEILEGEHLGITSP